MASSNLFVELQCMYLYECNLGFLSPCHQCHLGFQTTKSDPSSQCLGVLIYSLNGLPLGYLSGPWDPSSVFLFLGCRVNLMTFPTPSYLIPWIFLSFDCISVFLPVINSSQREAFCCVCGKMSPCSPGFVPSESTWLVWFLYLEVFISHAFFFWF